MWKMEEKPKVASRHPAPKAFAGRRAMQELLWRRACSRMLSESLAAGPIQIRGVSDY